MAEDKKTRYCGHECSELHEDYQNLLVYNIAI